MRISSIILALLTVMTVGPHAAEPLRAPGIGDLVQKLRATMRAVQEEAQKSDLPLPQSVDLTLATTLSGVDTGRPTFALVTAGSGIEPARAQTMKMKLTAPKTAGGPGPGAAPLRDGLGLAILEAARTVKAARSGSAPLTLDRMQVELGFVVEPGNEAAIVPVSLDETDPVKRHELQTMVLTFGKPE